MPRTAAHDRPRRGPFRKGQDLSARETGWRIEQCRYLYSGLPGAIMVSAVVAVVLVAGQSAVVAHERLFAWLLAFGAVSLGRMALWFMHRSAPEPAADGARWLRRYRIGAAAAGLAWALGGYLLFPPGNVPHQAFLAFAIAGISAGAAITQAADRVSMMVFAAPPLVTLIAMQALQGDAIALSMGAMVLVFFAFILFNAVRSHGKLQDLWRYRSTAIERDAQLASSEARLHHLLSAGPAVVYSCGVTGDFPATYISPNIAGMMGYTAEEFLAAPGFWAAHVHPDDLGRVRDQQRALLTRGRANLEYRFHHKSGEWRWTRDDQIVVRDLDGAPREIVGAWTDITARKAAEETAERSARALAESNASLERRVAERTAALSESEQRLARAQRAARLGSWEYDPRSGAWHWSDEFCRIFGLDASLRGGADAWTAVIHPEDRAAVLDVVRRSRETGQPYEIQYRIIRSDGQLRALRARGEVEKDGRRVGSVMDVTEQAQAERALAEAQRIAHLGNWEFDEETGALRWSDEVYRIFGVEPGAIEPTTAWLEAHIHPEDLERVRRTWKPVDERPRRYEQEYRIVRPNGEVRRVAEIGEPADWAKPTGMSYVGTVLDITERASAERNLAEAQRIAKTGSWEMLPDREENRWSEELYRLLGLSPERDAATDANWNRLIHPEDRDAVIAAYLAANREQKSYTVRYRLIRPDGELRHMAEHGEWIDGRFVGTLSDITEQERVQRSLAEAHRIAKVGAWEWIPGTKTLRWSDEARRIFGYDDGVAERDHRDWQRRVHPDDAAAVEEILAAKRNRGIPFELAYRIVLPDGAIRMIHEWIESELDERGKLIREVGIFQDVTESRQLELAMQALSRELIALEGAEYFAAAVERLSKLLNVEHVYIARMDPAAPGTLRVVAAIRDGEPDAGKPAWIEEAPGIELAAGQSILIDRGARSRYPGGAIVADGIEGYAGEPIGDHDGRIIGQIAVMSRRPLANPATARTILRMFRVAAAAAIGRERVHQRDAWLRAILDNTP